MPVDRLLPPCITFAHGPTIPAHDLYGGPVAFSRPVFRSLSVSYIVHTTGTQGPQIRIAGNGNTIKDGTVVEIYRVT